MYYILCFNRVAHQLLLDTYIHGTRIQFAVILSHDYQFRRIINADMALKNMRLVGYLPESWKHNAKLIVNPNNINTSQTESKSDESKSDIPIINTAASFSVPKIRIAKPAVSPTVPITPPLSFMPIPSLPNLSDITVSTPETSVTTIDTDSSINTVNDLLIKYSELSVTREIGFVNNTEIMERIYTVEIDTTVTLDNKIIQQNQSFKRYNISQCNANILMHLCTNGPIRIESQYNTVSINNIKNHCHINTKIMNISGKILK